MITKDSIETAYSFLHQKQRIYVLASLRWQASKARAHSTLDWQKDDIELAISDYANDMSQELYDTISGGRTDFLRDHKRFQEDITKAVEILEKML
jgi:hypothetical protein